MMWLVPLVLAASAEFVSGGDLCNSKYAECESAFGIGDTSRAEVLCREAYRLAVGNNLQMARIGNALGNILTSTGRYVEAEGLLKSSERLLRSQQGGYSADLAVVLSAQAALYILQWRPEPASKLLDEAAEIAARVNAPPEVVALVCREVAQLHLIRGRLDESRNELTRCLEIVSRSGDSARVHFVSAQMHHLLGRLEMERRRPLEAEQHFRHSLELFNLAGGVSVLHVRQTLVGLASSLLKQNRVKEAASVMLEAISMPDAGVSETVSAVDTVAKEAARACRRSGLKDEARILSAYRGSGPRAPQKPPVTVDYSELRKQLRQ